jgi:predicted RNase H-like HicB family nuclease
MSRIKIVVEKHEDGYVAYPVGMRGVVVGEGDSYEEALADIKSAIRFHAETFGEAAFAEESPVLEAFIAETELVDAEVSR